METVLASADTGLSIAEPRISPDGRWLLFCMSEYGSFPAYQPSSDLYLLDLETGDYHALDEVNSPLCESWHSWSSNSRWIAFASKRRDGVFARIYFSYVDETGHAHKPLVLPQRDPTYYRSAYQDLQRTGTRRLPGTGEGKGTYHRYAICNLPRRSQAGGGLKHEEHGGALARIIHQPRVSAPESVAGVARP